MSNFKINGLLVIIICFCQTSFAQLILKSETTYFQNSSKNKVVVLEYYKGEQNDTVLYASKKYIISKIASKNEVDLFITNNLNNDTLYKYEIRKDGDSSIIVQLFINNQNEVCKMIKNFYTFNMNVDQFFNQIDYVFISNLSKYNSYLPDECEVNEFPIKDLFYSISESRYGKFYKSVLSETDSVFTVKKNEKVFLDFQKYLFKDGRNTGAVGFYHNSFNEIRKDTIPIITFKYVLKNKGMQVVGYNELSKERFHDFYKDNRLIQRKIKHDSSIGKYELTTKYYYFGDSKIKYVTSANKQKVEETVQYLMNNE